MNFTCDTCQKAYTIADEKVAGRSFRVTCKACGHVIQVKASAPAAAAPPPAPVLQAAAPPVPVLPAAGPAPAAAPPPLEHQTLETTDQHDLFYASKPTHRPRVTAEWMLQSRRRRPLLFASAAALAGLVVAGAVAYSFWQVRQRRPWPPEAASASRQPPPVAPPQRVVMPAETVKAESPAPPPAPVELPPEAPLVQRGAAPPRAVGGPAGFESVGGGAGGSDVRDRLRQRNLTIAKKDKRLLDLLDKKQDSALTRSAAVEKTELDTGRAELDTAAVRQTMATSANAYSACVSRSLKENPNLRLEGKRATLMLTIKASGVVRSAWIAEAELDKSPLGKCLVGVSRRMVFPAFTGDPIDVSAPLALSGSF